MLRRKQYDELLWWHNNSKKALLVTGARQIGKSYLVRHLGKTEFDCYVEINLYEDRQARKAFSSAESASDLINRISLFTSEPLVEGNTLIFIDEIQELPDIMTMAKFLVEDGRYSYAFSGSMLGTEFKGVRSFPVGFVHEIIMRPMDFEEFCWANGVNEDIFEKVFNACSNVIPVPDYIHSALLAHFRAYVAVGGMPEVVERFVGAAGELAAVREIQSELVQGYRRDVSKYAGRRALSVTAIFDELPIQLDNDSRRFVLNSVDDTARYERYRQDFVWLVNAGIALKTNLVREPKAPLAATERPGHFKLYQSDTGMLVSRYSSAVARAVYLDDVRSNFGGVYENVVAQELCCAGFPLFYYAGKKRGEVDFIVEASDGNILPIEVKSGRNARAHAALDNLLNTSEYDIPQGVVLSRLNVEKDGKVLYLPWYAVSCLSRLFACEDDADRFVVELPRLD